jgi:hypothetical protein
MDSHLSAFTTLGTAMIDLRDAMVANDWNAVHTDARNSPKRLTQCTTRSRPVTRG